MVDTGAVLHSSFPSFGPVLSAFRHDFELVNASIDEEPNGAASAGAPDVAKWAGAESHVRFDPPRVEVRHVRGGAHRERRGALLEEARHTLVGVLVHAGPIDALRI